MSLLIPTARGFVKWYQNFTYIGFEFDPECNTDSNIIINEGEIVPIIE